MVLVMLRMVLAMTVVRIVLMLVFMGGIVVRPVRCFSSSLRCTDTVLQHGERELIGEFLQDAFTRVFTDQLFFLPVFFLLMQLRLCLGVPLGPFNDLGLHFGVS